MSATDISFRSATRSAGWRWRPLSMLSLSPRAGYPGFVLTCLWIALTVLCIWWPLGDNGLMPHGAGFTWNRFEVHLGAPRRSSASTCPGRCACA